MGTISTSDIVSVLNVAPRQYNVTLWTAEGEPIDLRTFGSFEMAEDYSLEVAAAVRSWAGAKL